jgi:hypothetical protein
MERETSDDPGNESKVDLLGEPSVVIVEGKQVDLTLPPAQAQVFTRVNRPIHA